MTKIINIVKSLLLIPPVFTDGFLLVLASFCAAVLTYLSSDEAYKYVLPHLLFWLKLALGSTSSSISALVAFRSKVYTQYQQQVKANLTGEAQTTTTEPVTKKE